MEHEKTCKPIELQQTVFLVVIWNAMALPFASFVVQYSRSAKWHDVDIKYPRGTLEHEIPKQFDKSSWKDVAITVSTKTACPMCLFCFSVVHPKNCNAIPPRKPPTSTNQKTHRTKISISFIQIPVWFLTERNPFQPTNLATRVWFQLFAVFYFVHSSLYS